MTLKLPKIRHLIRYFAVVGLVIFIAYWQGWQAKTLLIFMGPCIYLSSVLQNFAEGLVPSLPLTHTVYLFAFLLPVTLAYYGLTSFLIKKLWNERGPVRYVSVIGFIGFLIFIHYFSLGNLTRYLSAAP